MKIFSPAFTAQKDAQVNRPIDIFELQINDVETLFITNFDEDVDFAGQIYQKFVIKFQFISTRRSGFMDPYNVILGNATRFISQKIADNNALRRNTFVGKRIWYDTINDAVAVATFTKGRVHTSSTGNYEAVIRIRPDPMSLTETIPTRFFLNKCQWKFDGEDCLWSVLSNKLLPGTPESKRTQCDHTVEDCIRHCNKPQNGGFVNTPRGLGKVVIVGAN